MGSFPSALRPGDHAGDIEKKGGNHRGNNSTTTIIPDEYDERGEITQYIHPKGGGSTEPLRREGGEEEMELAVPVNKVAPFENGRPSIEEYDYIYGCFLEEDVSSDDENDEVDDDKHTGKNTTTTKKKKGKKNRKKSKHFILDNSFLKSLLTPKNVSTEAKKSLPGKLYRLVKESCGTGASGGSSGRGLPFQRWFFYNDTKDLKMVVTGYFGASSELRANDNTNMWREMPTGFVIAELVIPPLSTLGFIEGSVRDGYDLRFHAFPA